MVRNILLFLNFVSLSSKIYFIGPENCRNYGELLLKKPGRQFTQFHLKRQFANGSKIDREWIVFSPTQESIFCFVCRLFGEAETFGSDGFNDWKNLARGLQRHERSTIHLQCDITYRTRAKNKGTLDESFENSAVAEAAYWRKVLLRIVEVIKHLCSRNLAFRGNSHMLGAKDNGNFLGTIELLSKFDPFLESHLARYGNKGRGK